MIKQYDPLNPELKMLLFSIEKACGVQQGGGRVFTDKTKRREIADVKHIFAFIAITYLEYTHKQVREWLSVKYDSNINHARRRIADLVEFNPAYRNRVYGIAIENGVMPLVNDIIEITDKNKKSKWLDDPRK